MRRYVLEQRLHVTSPLTLELLLAWEQERYGDLSLVRSHAEMPPLPCELGEFRELQKARRLETTRLLEDGWLHTVLDRFSDMRSAWFRAPDGIARRDQASLELFFESMACLMSNQLRSVTTASLRSLRDFFTHFELSPDRAPEALSAEDVAAQEEAAELGEESTLLAPCALKVKLVWEDGRVQLQPAFEEAERSVLEVFDKAVLSLSSIPRVESTLFSSQGAGQRSLASVSLDEGEVKDVRQYIVSVLRANEESPGELVKRYRDFEFLLNDEAETAVSEILSRNRPLGDYEREIKK